MKNKYIHRAHISERKTRQLIKCFALDLTGTQTAEMTGLNLNTVDRIFGKIRARILENSQASFPEQGGSKRMRATLARAGLRASEVEEPAAKPLSLGFTSAMEKYTQKLCQTQKQRPYKQLSEAKRTLRA